MYILQDTVTCEYYYYTLKGVPKFGKRRQRAAHIEYAQLELVIKHLMILVPKANLIRVGV